MTVGVAGLPMYDWPEVNGAINALWSAIADRIQLAGVETPASVWRPTGHQTLTDLWTHPDLLLAQACGLPVVQDLARKVTVLGSLDYTVPGCDPGDYRSVLVCRTDDPSSDLAAFRGRRVAFNESDSQSGMGALATTVAPLAINGQFFSEVIESGEHRQSIRLVADRRVDLASIDVVSWRLALEHEPATEKLRILTWTDPTPGVPLITGRANDGLRDLLNTAISEAVAALDTSVRDSLHLHGYRPRPASDYDVITERLVDASNSGYSLAEQACW